MNRYMQEKWSWIEGTHGARITLLDSLTDADMAFTPGGQAMTLGALCREMGEVQHSYIQSLKSFKQDWDYRSSEPGLENSVTQMKAWYLALDDELKATVTAFSDDDLQKTIERPGGFAVPVDMQLDIYLQALLIFFGKASIYLRVMDRPLPGGIEDWIG